ncbi:MULTISPECIES: hypothetical protein [unclassified Prochlorococcus]|uniref:hypothetical protein n=1 Tax=unclassified Prochlorococcus TaxID=2627481 RepID=UPI0005336DEC|nr:MULTISPECIES: hypothetical protein [unclassified Prochlorococcus]KGG16724.1 hypothetical protein EV06_0566 [Prochlorococcus sp. MIT 0602]KGG18303.1 hypothetical protein EV07_0219 [Prochlorococcus sp. MIT 0603]
MNITKSNLKKITNIWIMPFLFGGFLAIGYEGTKKALIRLQASSKESLTLQIKNPSSGDWLQHFPIHQKDN